MHIAKIVIRETEEWIALNKPSGLLSIPDREGKELSLKDHLASKYGQIFTVHRLDKETSGVIVFAKNEATHKVLSGLFEQRQTEKIYLGLVLGSPLQDKGTIDSPIMHHPAKNGTMVVHRRGKPAQTDYEVLKDFGIYSWVKFRLHTGRTHQIRVHTKELGHPIACDNIYGDGKPVLLSSLKLKKYKLSRNDLEERPLLNRLALHAFQLSYQLEGEEPVKLEAPLPKDLRAVLQQLSKWRE